jgi:hypothetical protein
MIEKRIPVKDGLKGVVVSIETRFQLVTIKDSRRVLHHFRGLS